MNDLRQRLLNGEQVDECSACNVPKDVFSYKKFNNRIHQTINVLNGTATHVDLPQVIHLNLSNTCNLACRHCLPGNSSRLASLAKNSELQDFLPYVETNNTVDASDHGDFFTNAVAISIAGGEPFVDGRFMDLLEIIQKRCKKLRSINFATNLTRLDPVILDTLGKLPARVRLTVSIDGPPAINDYIRHMSSWQEIEENLRIITSQYRHFDTGVISTISAWNVGYVCETMEFLETLQSKMNFVFRNFLSSPVLEDKAYAGNLPDDIKLFYQNKINQKKRTYNILNSSKHVITALELLQQPIRDGECLREYTLAFDRRAKTRIQALFPELARWLSTE